MWSHQTQSCAKTISKPLPLGSSPQNASTSSSTAHAATSQSTKSPFLSAAPRTLSSSWAPPIPFTLRHINSWVSFSWPTPSFTSSPRCTSSRSPVASASFTFSRLKTRSTSPEETSLFLRGSGQLFSTCSKSGLESGCGSLWRRSSFWESIRSLLPSTHCFFALSQKV